VAPPARRRLGTAGTGDHRGGGAGGWAAAERRRTAELRTAGQPLTNLTAGGEGIDAPRTEEERARIGQANKGRVIPPHQRAAVRASNRRRFGEGCKRGHPWTAENTAWATHARGHRDRPGVPHVPVSIQRAHA